MDGGARAVPGNGTQGGTVVEDHVYRTGEDAPSALTGLITWISVTLNAGAAARHATVFSASLGPAKDVVVTTTAILVRCVTPPTRRRKAVFRFRRTVRKVPSISWWCRSRPLSSISGPIPSNRCSRSRSRPHSPYWVGAAPRNYPFRRKKCRPFTWQHHPLRLH